MFRIRIFEKSAAEKLEPQYDNIMGFVTKQELQDHMDKINIGVRRRCEQ